MATPTDLATKLASDHTREHRDSLVFSSFFQQFMPRFWVHTSQSVPPPPPGAGNTQGNVANTEAPEARGLTLFPCNPSIGLQLFAPIVPASDNKPALFLVSTLQALIGLTMMTRRVPRVGESHTWTRAASLVRFIAGSLLVLMSGLEYARLIIPYDPWSEEAKKWRHWAVKAGHNPSWWYGAIVWYTPMLMDEWRLKTTTWMNNTANALEAPRETSDESVLNSIQIGPHAALRAGESGTYHDIYVNLRQINRKRHSALLEGELANVTELNKAQRLDDIMEGTSHVHLNEDYIKPNIQLGLHTMESDEEFEMVWANFEPWDEMGQETDFDIRLIPQWRGKELE